MRALIVAALIPVAAIATEPPADSPARGGAMAKLIAADTDGDGSWSKAEWTAAGRRERGFTMLDADGDGLLTRGELRDGVAKFRERRAK